MWCVSKVRQRVACGRRARRRGVCLVFDGNPYSLGTFTPEGAGDGADCECNGEHGMVLLWPISKSSDACLGEGLSLACMRKPIGGGGFLELNPHTIEFPVAPLLCYLFSRDELWTLI
jgi:hypothetical protein